MHVIARSLRRSNPYLPCLLAYGLPRPLGLAMTLGSVPVVMSFFVIARSLRRSNPYAVYFSSTKRNSLTWMSRFFRLRLPRKVLYWISTVFTLPYFFNMLFIWSKPMKPSELYDTIVYLVSRFEMMVSMLLSA